MKVHRQFPYESVSERILQIGLQLQTLWPKSSVPIFSEHGV